MNIGFEKITLTPDYPLGTSAAQLTGLTWESQKTVVKKFKRGLKIALRHAQFGQCCYCRRQLNDDGDVDFEHFVDKDFYPAYTYEIKNLALSCGTCNTNKNGRFQSLRSSLKKRYAHFGPWFPVTPTIKRGVFPSAPFPIAEADFRWVSPHFHEYSQHITQTGPMVFRGISAQGRRTIRGCKLNDLAKVELRVFGERLRRHAGGALTDQLINFDCLSPQQAADFLRSLALQIEGFGAQHNTSDE